MEKGRNEAIERRAALARRRRRNRLSSTIGRVLASTLLLFAVMTGLTESELENPISVTDTENSQRAVSDDEMVIRPDTVFITVGNVSVYYPEAAWYMLSGRQTYEAAFGHEVWTEKVGQDTVATLVTEDVIEEIIQVKITAEKAREAGIELTEAEIAEIGLQAREQLAAISVDRKEKYYIDQVLLTEIYCENFLCSRYYDSLIHKKASEHDFMNMYLNWRNSTVVTVNHDAWALIPVESVGM